MKTSIIFIFFSYFLLSSFWGQCPTYAQPAFPGAEGFGSTTPGGRGGKVLFVTNLYEYGPGSLREALASSGPRIVVFRVGGVLFLQKHLKIQNPYLTIAGQTAPGDGIMISGAGINIIQSHDIIIRGLTIRPGDDPAGPRPGIRRAITIWGETANPSHDIIVDHTSLSWSTDEVVGVGYAHDVTFQYNIISEPLHNSIHQEGAHGYGIALYGKDPMDRITLHHNIITSGYNRNPQFAAGLDGEAINNIIYNWANHGLAVRKDALVNIIGNYFIVGPNTPADKRGVNFNCTDCGAVRLYVHGNIGPYRATDSGDEWLVVTGSEQYRSDTLVVAPSGVTIDPVVEIYAKLIGPAGAGNLIPSRQEQRDSVDLRILEEIETQTGRVRDCVDALPIYYPQGKARGGTSNTIFVEHHPGDTRRGPNPQNKHTYERNSIEIIDGTGAGQVRDVAAFSPWTNVVTVDRLWDIIPDTSSQYSFIIHCDNNAGGWPKYSTSTNAPADSDNDGMPDDWETANGLNINDPSDASGDSDGDGYTNIEEYINSLIPVPGTTTGVSQTGLKNFAAFQLSQNYPNPFNSETAISYVLSAASQVELTIYNINGKKLRTLINEKQSSGFHSVVWNGKDDFGNFVSSGMFFYQMKTNNNKTTINKMLLIK